MATGRDPIPSRVPADPAPPLLSVAEDQPSPSASKPERKGTAPKKAETPEEKAARIAREKGQLLDDIADRITSDLRGKVGYVLNHFPATRNSDIRLAHAVWETFYPEFIEGDRVRLKDMYRLPHQTTITRTRATIQNDYGLFQPSEDVAAGRRARSKETKDKILAEKPGPPVISIHADESGKNQSYLVVASVWIVNIAKEWRVFDGLRDWCRGKGVKSELKFAELSTQKLGIAKGFVKKAMEYSSVMSLKACVVDASKVKGRAQEEALFRLYYELVISGLRHEVETGRVSLPRVLSIVKDADAGPDALGLPDMERRIVDACRNHFEDEAKLDGLMTGKSHESPALQLADLFAGSVARVLNKPSTDSWNYKDDFAAFFESVAGFSFSESTPGIEVGDFAYLKRLG